MATMKVGILVAAWAVLAASMPPESPAPAAFRTDELLQEESRGFLPVQQQHRDRSIQNHEEINNYQQRTSSFGPAQLNAEQQQQQQSNLRTLAVEQAFGQGQFQNQNYQQDSFESRGHRQRGELNQGLNQNPQFSQRSEQQDRFQEQRQQEQFQQSSGSFQTQRDQTRFSASDEESANPEFQDIARPINPRFQGPNDRYERRQEFQDDPSDPSFGNYHYSYDIRSEDTGDMKYHKETRDGNKVIGEYRVKEADGSMRIVRYTADAENGFQATVEYVMEDEEPVEFGAKMPSTKTSSPQNQRNFGNRRVFEPARQEQNPTLRENTRPESPGRLQSPKDDMALFFNPVERQNPIQFQSEESGQNHGFQQFTTSRFDEESQNQRRDSQRIAGNLQTQIIENEQFDNLDQRNQFQRQNLPEGHFGPEFSTRSRNENQERFQSLNEQKQRSDNFPNQNRNQFNFQGRNQFQSQDRNQYQSQNRNQFQTQDRNQFQNQLKDQFQSQDRYDDRTQFSDNDRNQFQSLSSQRQNYYQNQNIQGLNRQPFQNQDNAPFQNQQSSSFPNQGRDIFQNQEVDNFQDQYALEEENQFLSKTGSQLKNQPQSVITNQAQSNFRNEFSRDDNTQFQNQFSSTRNQELPTQRGTPFHPREQSRFQGVSQLQNTRDIELFGQNRDTFQTRRQNQFQSQNEGSFASQRVTQFPSQSQRKYQSQNQRIKSGQFTTEQQRLGSSRQFRVQNQFTSQNEPIDQFGSQQTSARGQFNEQRYGVGSQALNFQGEGVYKEMKDDRYKSQRYGLGPQEFLQRSLNFNQDDQTLRDFSNQEDVAGSFRSQNQFGNFRPNQAGNPRFGSEYQDNNQYGGSINQQVSGQRQQFAIQQFSDSASFQNQNEEIQYGTNNPVDTVRPQNVQGPSQGPNFAFQQGQGSFSQPRSGVLQNQRPLRFETIAEPHPQA